MAKAKRREIGTQPQELSRRQFLGHAGSLHGGSQWR